MSDLVDNGDASQFHFACLHCAGVVDTATGTPAHTDTHLKWIGMRCSLCERTFNFSAGRSVPKTAP